MSNVPTYEKYWLTTSQVSQTYHNYRSILFKVKVSADNLILSKDFIPGNKIIYSYVMSMDDSVNDLETDVYHPESLC